MWWVVLLLATPGCLAFYGNALVPGSYASGNALVPGSYVATNTEIRLETLMTTCGGPVYRSIWISCTSQTFTCGISPFSGIECSNCQCKLPGPYLYPASEQWARGTNPRGCVNPSCDVVCWPLGFALDPQGCRTCTCNKPGVCPSPHCRKKCNMGRVVKTYDDKGCPICLCHKGNPA